jgi:hypothetical protein
MAANRATEARASQASRSALAVSRPAATPSRTAARREASRRPATRGARHAAHLSRGSSDTPRMRDAPQELIPVLAADTRGPYEQTSPRAACLAATTRAEQVHGLPNGLLTAIALAESGLHAYALSIGGRAHFPSSQEEARALLASAGARRSVMAGCVQVNARVHARGSDWPLDPIRSADWAGGMIARWANETGSWSEAVRRWHGGSPASTRRLVCRVRAKMEVTSPGANVFDEWSCDGTREARVQANGAAHLRTALLQMD